MKARKRAAAEPLSPRKPTLRVFVVETRMRGAIGVFTPKRYRAACRHDAIDMAHAEGLETRGVLS